MKINLKAIALSGFMALSGAAYANGLDCDPRFYIGGEIAGNKLKSEKEIDSKNSDIGKLSRRDKTAIFKKNNGSVSLIVGSRLNDYVGVEAGVTGFGSRNEKYINIVNGVREESDITLKMRNLYADALGYLPICEDIDLIGSVGIGQLSSKVSGYLAEGNVRAPFSAKSSKFGARIGAGVGVNFTENVNARLMFRHQQGNKHVKSVNSAGLGLFYQF